MKYNIKINIWYYPKSSREINENGWVERGIYLLYLSRVRWSGTMKRNLERVFFQYFLCSSHFIRPFTFLTKSKANALKKNCYAGKAPSNLLFKTFLKPTSSTALRPLHSLLQMLFVPHPMPGVNRGLQQAFDLLASLVLWVFLGDIFLPCLSSTGQKEILWVDCCCLRAEALGTSWTSWSVPREGGSSHQGMMVSTTTSLPPAKGLEDMWCSSVMLFQAPTPTWQCRDSQLDRIWNFF